MCVSVFVNRFRKGFCSDTYIYWMAEWDTSGKGEKKQIYSSANYSSWQKNHWRDKTCHILYEFRLVPIWPICTHICIKWFIIVTDILLLTKLSSKLSGSLFSKLEKFSTFSWHNPRHFEEYKAVDYRGCVQLLLLSTFILRHCHQSLKKYVCSSVQ